MKRLSILAALLLTAQLLMAQAAPPYIYNKVSPHLRHLVAAANARSSAATVSLPASSVAYAATASHPQLPDAEVLLKLADSADEASLCARYGVTIEARIGRVLIATLPLAQVEALAADPLVLRIEAERAPRKLLDVMPGQIGADKAHEGTLLPQAFTGEGVVVGIVDAGFDYVNPFFRDAQGTTRVAWATDYAAASTATLTSAADIMQAMHSSDAATEWHGTHVAAIAAGSRVHSTSDVPYQGIAPQADLAEACINLTGNNPILHPADPTAAPALRAMSDIFAWADEQHKPCVINFSAGITQTFADSRTLEEEALHTLVDQHPGRAIVVAAGNQGLYRYLAHKPAEQDKGGAGVRFHQEDYYGRYFGVQLKMRDSQTLTIRYTDADYAKDYASLTIAPSQLQQAGGTATLRMGSGTYMRRLTATVDQVTADGYTVIYIADATGTYPATDRMMLTVEGQGDAWLYADTSCAPLEDVAGVEGHQLTQPGCSVAWPASVDGLIAVGNTGHRFKLSGSWGNSIDWGPVEMGHGVGCRALSSACGPTLDGRTKPDVCAPGVNIVSAYNNFVNESYEQYLIDETVGMLDTEYEPQYGGFFALLSQTGTSMSAPAVTGTIALWMQADPTLTTDRILDVIAHTSRQPEATLSYPNSEYGHGEIDAYAGLLYLLDPSGVLPVSRHQPRQAAITFDGHTLRVTLPAASLPAATLRIYTTAGRLVAQHTINDSEAAISLATLPAGIYAVQLTTPDASTTGSTLIRL